MMQAGDIRELSFQNVVDQILKPNKVNIGGIPENVFLELTENEKETLICNICFLIVNDARQCKNEHLFCRTCIFAWSLTYGENSQKCPMCRIDQTEYDENKKVNKLLGDKRVLCPEDGCTFKAPLKIFLMHSHGKTKYSNNHVDFSSIQPPQRQDGARLLVLPNFAASNAPGADRLERAHSIRGQLQQGRMMIHQMMMLLHLEMQLRQQALTGFQEATDPHTRLNRLDEVMALNEQLNEVGTVLHTLLHSPINTIIDGHRVARTTGNSHLLSPDSPGIDLDDDEDDESSSDESSIVTALRREAINRRRVLSINTSTPPSSSNNPSTSSSSREEFSLGLIPERPLRQSEIRQSLLSGDGTGNSTNLTETPHDIPSISQGRRLSDFAQASTPSVELHPRVLMGRSQLLNRPVSRTSNPQNGSSGNEGNRSGQDETNVTIETTRRLDLEHSSTSSGRDDGSSSQTTLRTTTNARNQTLPSLPTVEAAPRRNASVVSPPQPSPTNTPRPSAAETITSNQEQRRTSISTGSSAFNEVRRSLQRGTGDVTPAASTLPSSSTGNSRQASSQDNSGSTSISWHSGSNNGSTPRPNSMGRSQPNSVARRLDPTRNTNNNESGLVASSANTPAPEERSTLRTSLQRGNEVGTIPNPNRRILNRSQDSSNTINTGSTARPSSSSTSQSSVRATTIRRGRNTEGRYQPTAITASLSQNNRSQPSRTNSNRNNAGPRRRSPNTEPGGSTHQPAPPSVSLSNSSLNTGRPRPSQQTRPTPLNQNRSNLTRNGVGQQRVTINGREPLLRARRRSEIQQDLMKDSRTNNS